VHSHLLEDGLMLGVDEVVESHKQILRPAMTCLRSQSVHEELSARVSCQFRGAHSEKQASRISKPAAMPMPMPMPMQLPCMSFGNSNQGSSGTQLPGTYSEENFGTSRIGISGKADAMNA
jgi:hypothetical protein